MLNQLMIIDDDPVTLRLYEIILNNIAFAEEVISLTDGREGIDYFSKFFERKKKGEYNIIPPDLILLDINMPILNGWDFLEEFIRKYSDRLPETKVAILSSSVNPEDFMKAQGYEIVIEFLNKPLTIDLLEGLKEKAEIAKFFV